jgi:hypothetical protein
LLASRPNGGAGYLVTRVAQSSVKQFSGGLVREILPMTMDAFDAP